jgi:hypothetical protein
MAESLDSFRLFSKDKGFAIVSCLRTLRQVSLTLSGRINDSKQKVWGAQTGRVE